MKKKHLKAMLIALGLSLAMSITVFADQTTENSEPLQNTEGVSEAPDEDEAVIDDDSMDTPANSDDQEEADLPSADEGAAPENVDPEQEPDVDTPEADEEEIPQEETEKLDGAQEPAGWNEDTETGKIFYINDAGEKVTGWLTVDGKVYNFDEEGYLRTGFYRAENKNVYYFYPEGTMGDNKGAQVRGWRKIDGEYFYFKKSGEVGDVRGKMLTGWQSIGGNTYFFRRSGSLGTLGSMFVGWKRVDEKVYYFRATGGAGERGTMLTGWRKIGDKMFYFNTSGGRGTIGVRRSGWLNLDGKRFFLTRSGGYGVTGSLNTGWKTIEGKKYYFKATGARGTKGMMARSGAKTIKNNRYYFSASGVMQTGWKKIGGYWYYFDPKKSGAMATGKTTVPVGKGYHQYSSYIFYFRSSKSGSAPKGSLIQDVTGIIGKQKNYRAEIDRVRCVVTIYAKDTAGKYRIPVKAMTCSVGTSATPTPRSSYKWPFHTIQKYRWATLMGPSYGQYSTRIVAGILFHSVAGRNTTSYNLSAANYNMLGQPASHGCVRLCVRDAKWIYDNCPLGMEVIIRDNMYQPFDKPATIKIPAGQTWDPTDPAV